MGKCTSCGSKSTSDEALPLAASVSSSVACSTCPSTACSCESTSPCQEDHTKVIIDKRYAFTLRVTNSFTWPAVGEDVVLDVVSVERLATGTLMYTANAGYLHVRSFDCDLQRVVARNQGESCNVYTGGEMLPSCTDFSVGPPTCGSGAGPTPNTPYLAADFISIANTACGFAVVTTIITLHVGDVVSVNGYEYRIGDILDSETIQLCNDGDGAPAGTPIYWDANNDGIPDIPLLVVSTEDPCTRTPIHAGVLLACDSGQSKPFEGVVDGQIAVWNQDASRWELKSITVPFTVCTALTADLVIDPTHVGSYIILVDDSSDFTAADIAVIENLLYTVDSVDNATTMHVTPLYSPGGVVTYGPSTPVCLDANNPCGEASASTGIILACDAGATKTLIPTSPSVSGKVPIWDGTAGLWKPAVIGSIVQEAPVTVGPSDLASPGSILTSPTITINISNVSGPCTYASLFTFYADFIYGAVYFTDPPLYTYVVYDIQINVNGAGFVTLLPFVSRDNVGPAIAVPDPIYYRQVMAQYAYAIAPGASLSLVVKASIKNETAQTNITSTRIKLNVTRIALAES